MPCQINGCGCGWLEDRCGTCGELGVCEYRGLEPLLARWPDQYMTRCQPIEDRGAYIAREQRERPLVPSGVGGCRISNQRQWLAYEPA